ncbi:MAG: DUF3891 family protein [Bacillota bacterium]
MIIREAFNSFYIIKQHDHAFLSGEIVKHFNREFLIAKQAFDDVLYAAFEHDRSWISLDETPIWNDRSHKPYTFADYPLLPKLAFYTIGLDEIEQANPYSSLLCSMHFSSFFTSSTNKDCLHFLKKERERQEKIKEELPNINEELLLQHFRLLQFSDNLSLYLCMNEPGVQKEDEHPWFKKGFKNTETLHLSNRPLIAQWLNFNEVIMHPFPFESDFQVFLKYKEVSKRNIENLGIAEAYQRSNVKEHNFFIRKLRS